MKTRAQLDADLQAAMNSGREAVLDLFERIANQNAPRQVSRYDLAWASGQTKSLLLTPDQLAMLAASAESGQKFCRLPEVGILGIEGLKMVLDVQGQAAMMDRLTDEKRLALLQREEQRRDDAAALVRRARR